MLARSAAAVTAVAGAGIALQKGNEPLAGLLVLASVLVIIDRHQQAVFERLGHHRAAALVFTAVGLASLLAAVFGTMEAIALSTSTIVLSFAAAATSFATAERCWRFR